VVQWGRAAAGYDRGPGGGLLVRCEDGTELAADLLVGADGSNSRIRAQRLPGVNRQELGILNIAIDTRTPAQLRDLVAERVARWSPDVRHLIAVTDPATIAPSRCAPCRS
jgi:2-polyprenyl-6-methoxyphenol hydroxylase-like FAD-dependent oxidoreductase